MQRETRYLSITVKDNVEVIAMAPEEECEKEMFVVIRWERDDLAVPLAQLTPIKDAGTEIRQAVEDWHYWVRMGYQLG
jgi:hypothetical protein